MLIRSEDCRERGRNRVHITRQLSDLVSQFSQLSVRAWLLTVGSQSRRILEFGREQSKGGRDPLRPLLFVNVIHRDHLFGTKDEKAAEVHGELPVTRTIHSTSCPNEALVVM